MPLFDGQIYVVVYCTFFSSSFFFFLLSNRNTSKLMYAFYCCMFKRFCIPLVCRSMHLMFNLTNLILKIVMRFQGINQINWNQQTNKQTTKYVKYTRITICTQAHYILLIFREWICLSIASPLSLSLSLSHFVNAQAIWMYKKNI